MEELHKQVSPSTKAIAEAEEIEEGLHKE